MALPLMTRLSKLARLAGVSSAALRGSKTPATLLPVPQFSQTNGRMSSQYFVLRAWKGWSGP